jgi:hypothetical protein
VYLAGTGVSKKFLKYLSPQISGKTKLFSSQISQAKLNYFQAKLARQKPKTHQKFINFDGTEYG